MTITLTREEAQQVLDVIERNIVGVPRYRATELLRTRLAQPERPDYSKAGFGKPQGEEGCAGCGKKASEGWALYCVKCTEREWVGLTDEEREEAIGWSVEHIEAKLKEKNT